MFYNKNSFRQLVEIPIRYYVQKFFNNRGLRITSINEEKTQTPTTVKIIQNPEGQRFFEIRNNFTFSKKEYIDTWNDTYRQGETTPHIVYVSKTQVKEFFHSFRELVIEGRNFDNYTFLIGILVIPRKKLLNNIGRIAGLDCILLQPGRQIKDH